MGQSVGQAWRRGVDGDCGQRCVYGRTAALVHGCILVSSTRFMLQVRCFGRNDDIHVNTKAYVVHCLQSHTPTHQKSLKIAENRLKSRKIARNRAKSHAILRTIRSRVGLVGGKHLTKPAKLLTVVRRHTIKQYKTQLQPKYQGCVVHMPYRCR